MDGMELYYSLEHHRVRRTPLKHPCQKFIYLSLSAIARPSCCTIVGPNGLIVAAYGMTPPTVK
jgi:hypothetical protein